MTWTRIKKCYFWFSVCCWIINWLCFWSTIPWGWWSRSRSFITLRWWWRGGWIIWWTKKRWFIRPYGTDPWTTTCTTIIWITVRKSIVSVIRSNQPPRKCCICIVWNDKEDIAFNSSDGGQWSYFRKEFNTYWSYCTISLTFVTSFVYFTLHYLDHIKNYTNKINKLNNIKPIKGVSDFDNVIALHTKEYTCNWTTSPTSKGRTVDWKTGLWPPISLIPLTIVCSFFLSATLHKWLSIRSYLK